MNQPISRCKENTSKVPEVQHLLEKTYWNMCDREVSSNQSVVPVSGVSPPTQQPSSHPSQSHTGFPGGSVLLQSAELRVTCGGIHGTDV